MLKKIVLISVLLENFSKINKRPGPNKYVLGGKLLKNNKNVLDYYSEDESSNVDNFASLQCYHCSTY